MDKCIFCKIASNEIKSYKVYEDDYVIAFLDLNPASRGHTLVVTKEHFDNFTTVPKDILNHTMNVAQLIAQAAITKLGAKGINIITNVGKASSQSIMHFHVHVIPRYEDDGLSLTFPPKQIEDKELLLISDSIKSGM